VRINVQLIDAISDEHIWSESFENEIEDVLALQKEIARAIADAVAATVSPDEQHSLSTAGKVDPRAYEAILKGQFHLQRFTPQDMQKAAEYFTQAVEIDPDSALAYNGLSALCGFRAQAGLMPPEQARSECLPPTLKALELDDSLPEAYLGYANHMAWLRFDWAEAESAFRKAIDLNPSFAQARMFYSHFLTLTGDFEGGWEQMRLALEDTLWAAYHELGERDKSIAAVAKFFRIHGDPAVADALENAYAGGDYAGALITAAKMMEEQSETMPVMPMILNGLYEYAGEAEKAIDWAETAVREGGPGAPYIGVVTKSEAIRKNPRFHDLLREMNLDYWVEKYAQR
jgi:Tfp pilus assembly protein PilF